MLKRLELITSECMSKTALNGDRLKSLDENLLLSNTRNPAIADKPRDAMA